MIVSISTASGDLVDPHDLEAGGRYTVEQSLRLTEAWGLAERLPLRSPGGGLGLYPPRHPPQWIRLKKRTRDSLGMMTSAGITAVVGVIWRDHNGVAARVWRRQDKGEASASMVVRLDAIGSVVVTEGVPASVRGWTIEPL